MPDIFVPLDTKTNSYLNKVFYAELSIHLLLNMQINIELN